MKKTIIVFTTLLFILAMVRCEKKGEDPQYDIYENHTISACGVNDPLQNIEWLKKYCKDVKEKQTVSSVYIDLYKFIDEDEYTFRIAVPSLIEYVPNDYYSDTYYLTCSGDTIFHWRGDLVHADPSRYYEFMEDKEFIAELFHFVKQ